MKKSLFNRVGVGFIALGLVLAQVVMPVQAAFADAPGNNGTVKINDEAASDDPGNGNEPQLSSCTVFVRWYGFDAGLRDSTVTFEAQSPTENQLVSPTGPQDADFTAPTPVTGDTLSHKASYTLAFSGTPAAQGYKVKATVDTDGSQGNHTKSKVFWVPSSCATPERLSDPTISLTEVCGLNNDLVTPGTSDDYTAGEPVWGEAGVSVTFTIKDGVNKVFASNGEKVITITKDEVNTETECEEAPERIASPTIGLVGVCDVANDTVTVSTSDDYTAGEPVWGEAGVSVTFTIKADVNKVFSANGNKVITITVPEENVEECPSAEENAPTPVFTPKTCFVFEASILVTYRENYRYTITPPVPADTLVSGVKYIITENGTYTVDGYKTLVGLGGSALLSDARIREETKVFTQDYIVADANGCGSSGPTDPEPETPVVPAVPTAPTLPAELPYTGPAEAGSAKGLLFALVAAAVTYGAVYFAQPKRRYE